MGEKKEGERDREKEEEHEVVDVSVRFSTGIRDSTNILKK
jgi:hypothetical protein